MSAAQEQVVRRYLTAMEAGRLEDTLACFDRDAVILSPVYGEVPVGDFYRNLFDDTDKVTLDLHTVYASTGQDGRWAAHFGYYWKRRDGSEVTTNLVDLFEFNPATDRISRLEIVFNPSPAPGR